MKRVHDALPAAALVFNALVWGLSWWPLRELQAQGLHPLWSTALIYLLALPLLLWRLDGSDWRRQPMLWGLALAAGLTNVGFNWAVTVGDVVRVVLLFYLMPVWATLLAWPMLGERPSPAALARLGLALLGVSLVLKTPDSDWPLPASLADGLAIAGGACFALTNILLRKLRQTAESARMLAMFGGGLATAVVAGLLGASVGLVEAPVRPGAAALMLALLTGLALLLANWGLQYGAARLAAATTALVMLTEVVFASLSSVALGAAELNPQTLAGGLLILGVALWAALDGAS
ncbi:MAG: EamA family transporter [Hylemonella sp.]